MLLLFLPVKKFRLGDHFLIRQGFTINDQSTGSSRYKILNMGDISLCEDTDLNTHLLKDYFSDRDLNDKTINANDYIITCKGVVKGISLLRFQQEITQSEFGIIPSNHFLILTPKASPVGLSELNENDISFLHNLLNYFIGQLDKIASEKSGSNKYLTISDCENFEFSFDSQMDVLMEYNPLYRKYLSLVKQMKELKQQISYFNNRIFHNDIQRVDSVQDSFLSKIQDTHFDMEQEKEKLSQLRENLVRSKFSFLPLYEITLSTIYDLVKERYPELTNDSYSCQMNCKTEIKTPEWHHRVRGVLQQVKGKFIEPGSKRGSWIRK